jgi:hypothetical protein
MMLAVIVLSVFAGKPLKVFAQTDDTDDTQNEDSQQDQQNVQSQFGNALTWVEVRITTDGPPVYVPARCVTGVPFTSAIAWTGSRDESLARAREDLAEDSETSDALAQVEEQSQIETTVNEDALNPEQVLAGISCTTPVFAAPRGEMVEDERLLAGQTWFVTPILWVMRIQQVEASTSSETQQSQSTPESTREPDATETSEPTAQATGMPTP